MDIIDLIERKNFNELNSAELSLVLNEMTQLEYEEKRQLYLMSKAFFEKKEKELIVPIPTLALEALRKKKKQRGGVLVLLQSKVSIWKAAAIIVLLLTTYHMFQTRNKADVEKVYLTEYVTKESTLPARVDTVYVDKIKKVYVQTKPKTELVNTRVKERNKETYDLSNIAMLNNIEEAINYTNPNRGFSLNDDTLAKKIIGI